MLIPFARQSREGNYSGERLRNLFLRPSDGVSSGVLMGGSGSLLHVAIGSAVKAIVDNAGTIYAAAGGAVWKIEGGTATNVGSINSGETYMAASGTEVAIVAGGKYYVCNGTTTTEYPTGAVDTPKCVAYLNGRFIVAGEGAGRKDMHTVSDLDDGTTFDAGSFAFAEAKVDEIIGVIEDHGEVLFFGPKSVESWFDAGGAGYPLIPNTSGRSENGCLNGKTVAKADNGVFWVGADNKVFRRLGGDQVISTREVGETIKASTVVEGFTFKDRDHEFYALRLEGKPTLLYDMTTGLWSERTTGITESEWLCTCRETSNGVEYFGTSTGDIVTLDENTFTDLGEPLVAEAISVPVENRGYWFSISRIVVSIRGGTGGIGRTPQAMLQTSRDGLNWGVEKWRNVGDKGEYNRFAEWFGLGAFRRFQIRLRITDPIPRDIYGVDYE